MRVLVACEFSGIVRDAFIARGHDAWSCDLLPSERPGPHIQGDVLPVLKRGWDLVIAHPPCTDLAASGARYFAAKRADGRMDRGAEFFMRFVDCAPRWAIENPVGVMSTRFRKPDQIVQPWQWHIAKASRIVSKCNNRNPTRRPAMEVSDERVILSTIGRSVL